MPPIFLHLNDNDKFSVQLHVCVHMHACVCSCMFRRFNTQNKDIVKVNSLFLLIKRNNNIVNVPDIAVWTSRKMHY